MRTSQRISVMLLAPLLVREILITLLAMSMVKGHPKVYTIIHEFCSYDVFDRSAVLNPLYQCRQHIVRTCKRLPRSGRSTTLSNDPASWARIAVEHARDTEEAKKPV